ncbi:MAG: molybdopterin-dependent oxidoreductase [Peptococcaceae bacterium]|nr:molybdopterin-dependent oxidoreductase [Peptococcaceae bacterium]
MSNQKSIAANCRFCGYQCALQAEIVNGKVIKVRPDASRFPYDDSIQARCRRWRRVPEVLDHPQRINYPLKRVGERGSGKWQRISWEQALDEIADRLQALKQTYGPETLATSIGGPHTTFWPLHRFMTLFGSPNNMGIGQICWNPGILVNAMTYGWPIDMELHPDLTECALLWGVNPAESDNSLFWHTIQEFSRRGKPIIVVDPRKTATAKLATLWLPVRPGTDPVLALGLLHVIIREKLYNLNFVDLWCHGFAELEKHVASYSPSYVEAVTGVKAEDVIKAARLFAGKFPATLYSGRGIDQLGPNTVPTHRALAILRAVTGNVDVPGASHISEMPDFIPEIDLELSAQFPEHSRRNNIARNRLLLQSYSGYERLKSLTMKHNKRLPMRYLTSAHPNLIWRAMLNGEPYPVRSMIVMASDPLLTQADTHLIYQALKSLDLLVVLELFKTPTAMLADYILPAAGVMERPLMETKAGTANIAYGGDQAVEPYYERRPDYYFWREIGLRLGQTKEWPWKTYREALQASLSPAGVGWEDFCKTGLYCASNQYFKYQEINPQSGQASGFATASGKIELYSNFLEQLNADALPTPKALPEVSPSYPLKLITGARFHPYYASSYHQLQEFRRLHPHPWAEMSSATAAKFGLEDGSRLWVETKKGKARFVAKISEMCDDVISVEYGWWYPEMEAAEPSLGGLWLSNANILTSAEFESSDPLIGTWIYNGLSCRIEKIQ